MHTPEPRTIVIVGGVAGGASAATRARRCNENARIVLFEKDPWVSYANCGLPYFLGGEIQDRGKLLITTPDLLKRRFDIEVHTSNEVIAIDRNARTVSVSDLRTGVLRKQGYDRLILAPGASPIIPQVEGVESDNVFALRSLSDMDRIHACLEETNPRRAVVVGAGFIGLEMVEQLHRLGIQTAIVELADQVLAPLDPEMAHMVQTELERHEIVVCLEDRVRGLKVRGNKVTAVETEKGRLLDSDLLILAIGVRPNNRLALEAGLEVGESGGIRVNERMQSSDPVIYAVGDAVEYPHEVYGRSMKVPLAGPANRAGRVAGENAATDGCAKMAPVLGTAIVRVFDRVAAVTGASVKDARRLGLACRAATVSGKHHAGYYPGGEDMVLKVVYSPESGRLLGAQAVGGAGVDKRIDVLATAIHLGATMEDLSGLDLAYAPPFGSARDPIHHAAFVSCNDLEGFSRLAPVDWSPREEQIIDVRSEREVQEYHLQGTLHIPVDQLRSRLSELDPSKNTVVVCQSGQRAHIAARILRQRGFSQVSVLTGGMLTRKHACPSEIVWGK